MLFFVRSQAGWEDMEPYKQAHFWVAGRGRQSGFGAAALGAVLVLSSPSAAEDALQPSEAGVLVASLGCSQSGSGCPVLGNRDLFAAWPVPGQGAGAADSPTAAKDLFPNSVIKSVALRSLEPKDAISDRPDVYSAIRCKLSRPRVERMERWRDLGLLDGSRCREIGERDPLGDLTTSERLARRYPPVPFEIGGLSTVSYERYTLGPYASRHPRPLNSASGS